MKTEHIPETEKRHSFSDLGFKGIVVDRALSFFNWKSLEIALSAVPFKFN